VASEGHCHLVKEVVFVQGSGHGGRGAVYSFPVAMVMSYHQPGGSKHRHLFFHESGGYKSEIEMLASSAGLKR
jgi:hypothetical protein